MRTRSLSLLLGAAVALATVASAQTPAAPPAQPAPQPASTSAKPKASIYDEKADAKAQIAKAVARAGKENKRVLIQWGANWCTWCVALDGLYKSDKGIAKELNYEYELVLVDIGKWDKNMDLALAYGAELKGTGVPYLTVLDSSGKAIANQETSVLEVSREEKKVAHDPKAVMGFLTKNQAPSLNAEDVLKDGLSKAKNENKLVFVHFGAPWCGWCHRLENWMAKPEIASILGKEFIDVKIDIDRTTGGNEVLARFNSAKSGGIPWFVFLDQSGKPLADSNGKKGNIGFPAAPEEIEHFAVMLAKAHKNLTDAEITTLTASLESERKATEKH